MINKKRQCDAMIAMMVNSGIPNISKEAKDKIIENLCEFVSDIIALEKISSCRFINTYKTNNTFVQHIALNELNGINIDGRIRCRRIDFGLN